MNQSSANMCLRYMILTKSYILSYTTYHIKKSKQVHLIKRKKSENLFIIEEIQIIAMQCDLNAVRFLSENLYKFVRKIRKDCCRLKLKDRKKKTERKM